jgi:N-acetylglucosamine-6-phosphate deacetylase
MGYAGYNILNGQAIEFEIEHNRIVNINKIETSERLPFLSPGFLDMQVNGYKRIDYRMEGLSEHHIHKIIHYLEATGTTHHLPTIVTTADDCLLANLKTISNSIKNSEVIAEAIAGIHMEGPYLSKEDGPRGAHDSEYVKNPDFEEFQKWQEAAGGQIRVITLAPERKGAIDFIRKVVSTGVIVSLGHTNADGSCIRDAIRAGASMTTHLGNGSHGMLPRLNNYIWEQLAADELTASIICDGFHLPESVVKVFNRAKGLDRLILISDVACFGGLTPGKYSIGNINVQVFEDGHLGLLGTEYLAGAGHLLDRDIAQFMNFTGCSLAETIPLCTVNPAKLIGLQNYSGTIEIGEKANLILFNWQIGNHRLDILKSIRNGKEVY